TCSLIVVQSFLLSNRFSPRSRQASRHSPVPALFHMRIPQGRKRMLSPLLLLLLCSLTAEARPKFDDDENLFENLNKTLLEISNTPVEDLTLDELSAASGKHIPEQHRQVAEELLKYRTDRPLRALLPYLVSFGSYTQDQAEEFSRAVLRSLLDKSYILPSNRELYWGDYICRCNQRDCASVHNELYAVMGPEMASFCRVDKYGHCITQTKVIGNHTKVDLYCAPSHATEDQKEHRENQGYDHHHSCLSTKKYGKKCCKGVMCNDVYLNSTDPVETALETKLKETGEQVAMWKGLSMTLLGISLLLGIILALSIPFMCRFVDLDDVRKKLAATSLSNPNPTKKVDETTGRLSTRYYTNESDDKGSDAGSESPLIAPSIASEATSNGCSTNPTKSFCDTETTIGVGTGHGGDFMTQRTLSSFIRLSQPLGQGKFGRVFLGEWRGGEKLAVKKFDNMLIDSFEQEVEILMSGMMSNSNILRWIGKDTVSAGQSTEFWIMSEYHPNGSLFDYMDKHSLSQQTFLIMMRGIANGISFLHSEISANEGTTGKKGVAHRDLKTKNILVKSDLTCVIADFGMAVMNDAVNGVKLPPGTKKSGTVRYNSPEVLLDQLTHQTDFEHYRSSDMYSFALIMWECARRTHAVFGKTAMDENSMDDSLAYYNDVPREPSVADMREAVCDKGLRPAIDEMWNKNPVFFEMARIMRECWSVNSTARLTALNVKITIDRLSSQLNLNLPTFYD
ncbi:hypothetical protein PFISCL1PPCAC_16225, partial [Pristionchus fissidentatus]